MPDSQPRSDGPDSYDEHDLDALLSGLYGDTELAGSAGGVPDALLPVAGTLAALRAGPAAAELAGEDAARATFRLFRPQAAGAPDWNGPHWNGPRGHRRRAARGARWRVPVVAAAAAAVVSVGAAALAGTFSGAGGQPGKLAQSRAAPLATATAAGRGAGSQAVDGRGATREPTPSPTPRATSGGSPTAGADTLCREFFASFTDPASWSEHAGLGQQLSQAAGGAWNIDSYCLGRLAYQPWAAESGVSGHQEPGKAGVGSGQGQDQPPGNGGPGKAQAGPGGGGFGGHGPGQGGQGEQGGPGGPGGPGGQGAGGHGGGHGQGGQGKQ
ncbi:MAG TPA: hypothetical protein VHF26_23070 [Trebonia sp.]|nr:hypothetical protein [Trebonia sp.]